MNRIVRLIAKVVMPLMAALTVMLYTGAAYASVDQSMDDFFDNSNAMVNVTGPSAYQGQQYGYYTFGSLSYRTPTSNVKLGSVRLPSVRAGCGGIDLFSGGFSFVNSDQLVAMAKNIASNALGLLFQMAVDSLSELLGTNIKDFLSKVQKAVGQNIDSCEAAQSLIASTIETVQGSQLADCIKVGVNSGKYSDYSDGYAKCGVGGEAASTLSGASSAAKSNTSSFYNIAWAATRKNPLFASDTDLAEVMMTLTGTVISNAGASGSDADGNSGAQIDFQPGMGGSPAILTALLDGGTVNVLDCKETVNCYELNSANRSVTIASSNGLGAKVKGLLNDVVSKIINRQSLTTEEQQFIANSPLPVYKMASVAVANDKTTAAAEMAKYSDYLATLVAMSWIETNINEVQKAAANVANVPADQKAQWTSNVLAIRSDLNQREQTIEQKLGSTEAVLNNFRAMEDDIRGRVSSRFSDSYNFVNGMKRAS